MPERKSLRKTLTLMQLLKKVARQLAHQLKMEGKPSEDGLTITVDKGTLNDLLKYFE